MTKRELEVALAQMDDEEFAVFRKKFGGQGDRQSLVSEFLQHPNLESSLCDALGLQTEADKLTNAQVRAADAAVQSAAAAREANQYSRDANDIAQRAIGISEKAQLNSRWATIWAFGASAVAFAALAAAMLRD